MKTRIVLYGENDTPASILGDNPQEKVKKAWDAVIALLDTTTDDILRVESVEVWDDKADTPQTAQKVAELQKMCGIEIDPDRISRTDCGWK